MLQIAWTLNMFIHVPYYSGYCPCFVFCSPPKCYAGFCYKLRRLFLLSQITHWLPQVWNILVLILTANVAGVHMSEKTFKMLQNVGKLTIFIMNQEKTIYHHTLPKIAICLDSQCHVLCLCTMMDSGVGQVVSPGLFPSQIELCQNPPPPKLKLASSLWLLNIFLEQSS